MTSTGVSTSSAAVRPVRSAPGPRSGSSGRVREVGEFPGDDAHRFGRIGPGHRADPGGAFGCSGKVRLVIVIRHMSSLEPPADKPATSARPAGAAL